MAMRYSVAMHRLKDAERSQDRSEQLSWAGNEMASIIRDGDGLTIDHPVAWAGLSMVHKAQHEIASGFRTDQSELREVEEHAVYSLYQVSISGSERIFCLTKLLESMLIIMLGPKLSFGLCWNGS